VHRLEVGRKQGWRVCRYMSLSARGAITVSRRLCGAPGLRHHRATGVVAGSLRSSFLPSVLRPQRAIRQVPLRQVALALPVPPRVVRPVADC